MQLPARRLVGTFAVLAALALAGPAAAQAVIDVEHVSVSATAPDGIVGPGDTVDIAETIRNRGGALGSALTATLSSTSASMGSANGTYVALGAGATAANTPPFQATLPSTVPCGDGVPFSLGLSGPDGTGSLAFEVPTGIAGPRRSYESEVVPRAIPASTVGNASLPGGVRAAAAGDTLSTVLVPDAGTAKAIRVRIGWLLYPDVAKLRLTLFAPGDAASAVLYDGTATGADFHDQVFTVPSGVFGGVAAQGTWRLEIATSTPAQTGELAAWGLDIDPAVCDPAPVADLVAAASTTAPDADVAFDASRSISPLGEALTYAWSVDGAPFVGSASTTRTERFSAPGAHTVRVRVTDASARTSIAERTVTVTQPPTANVTAAPMTVRTGVPVALDSHSADADGTIARHQWDLDGNGTFEHDTAAVKTDTATFARPGTYTVKVRVTDNAGAVVESQVALTVQTQTPLASFTLSPSVPVAGEATTLDASGSVDPDGRIAAYEWDLDGVPGFERTTTAPEIQHTFATSDPVTVRLRVTDDSGDATLGTATSTPLTITPNRRPVAALVAAPATVIAGESVALNAAGSTDPDGTLARYEWDLDGDGTYELDTSTTTAASRTYATAGRVTARVRVTDNRGTTSTASVEVVIEGAPSAPSRVDPPADLPASPVPAPAAPTAAPAPAPSAPLAVAAAVISPVTPASAPSLAPPAIVPLAAPGPANTRIMGTPMQALRDALRRGITLRCISDRDATCSVTATLSAKDAARLKLAPRGGRKPVVIGAGLGRSGARAGSVVVRLTARAARRMRGVKQVMVTLTGRATVDGRTVTLQRTVLLRA